MRTKVFYNLPESECYGCQACAQTCPKSAITMIQDKEGFLFPEINPEKCIECNLCEKSCPTQNGVISNLLKDTPCYVDAAWEKDLDARLESTSGGMFYVIASQWMKTGGVVYGAAFDKSLVVKHIKTSTIEELNRLRGSKYVQSDITGVYTSVKKDILNGDKVLFSGTPCQVAGLKSFLKKEYDNLLTIDLVCHGVPSPLIFKEHLKYIENRYGSCLKDYKFRGKKRSGWRAYIKYVFKKHKSKSNFWGGDFFAYSFYRARFNRRSCYTCGFSGAERVGDITLSDFWNAEKSCKPLRIQRKYGFNMVMCNTDKGKRAYEDTYASINRVTLPVDIAIKGDVRLRHTETMPSDRDSIFEEYYSNGYEWLVKNRGPRYGVFSRLIPTWAKNLAYEIKARI